MKGKLITLYRGPMFSGKSEVLINLSDGGDDELALRPEIDKRYGNDMRIYSKKGVSAPAQIVDHKNPQDILRLVGMRGVIERVIIDEVSFFPGGKLITVVSELTDRGIKVILGGLDYDSERQEWGAMLALSRIRGVRDYRLTAYCDGEERRCKEPAIWSYRKRSDNDRLIVGGDELYGAACDKHYALLHHYR